MHTGWDAPGMAAKQGRDARLGWNPDMKGAVVAPYPPGKTRFTRPVGAGSGAGGGSTDP
jgi:hypothetical protein